MYVRHNLWPTHSNPWGKLISNEAKQSKHHACIVNNTPTILVMMTMAEATMGTPSAAVEPSGEDLSLKASLFVRYLVVCLSGLRAASTVMGARTIDTMRT